jgi:ubiquinone/menaquinone biosynthesis C-methylase UbiE
MAPKEKERPMKGRESGMPDEAYWQTFFYADCLVEKMECAKEKNESITEFGSGYGTFTFTAARCTSGIIHAFDIEPDLVALVQSKALDAGLSNVRAEVRNFVAQGTGLMSESIDHAMLYNLLHIEEPIQLLKEAFRILRPGGIVSIIHWKYDPSTPRGPSMNIRPRPEQCRAWAEAAGFMFIRDQDLSECCKYHYGLILTRPYAKGGIA